MGGRIKGGSLSQTRRSITRRARYAEVTRLAELETNGTAPDNPSPDLSARHVQIGIFSAKKPTTEAEIPVQEYHCNDCKSPVPIGSKSCPICQREVIWPEGMET